MRDTTRDDATTAPAYWLNGTAYCEACVEDDSHPCMSEDERGRATVAPGVGRCGCCKEPFAVA